MRPKDEVDSGKIEYSSKALASDGGGLFYVKTMSKSSEFGYISRSPLQASKKFSKKQHKKAVLAAYTVRGNLKGVRCMKISSYKNYDNLPLFLNAATVAKVLGIAPSSSYELLHEPGFPVLKIGSRMVVPKEKFIEWVEQHTGGQQ